MKNWKFKLEMWWAVTWIHWSCKLWTIRGLKACDIHGFHAQSWITGKCRKCHE